MYLHPVSNPLKWSNYTSASSQPPSLRPLATGPIQNNLQVAKSSFLNEKQIPPTSPILLPSVISKIFEYLSSIDLTITASVNQAFHQKSLCSRRHLSNAQRNSLGKELNSPSKTVDLLAEKKIFNIKIFQTAIGQHNIQGYIAKFYTTYFSTDTQSVDSRLYLKYFNFANNCKDLNIFLFNGKDEKKIIKLPNLIAANILRFLQTKRPDPKFCCHDFLNFVNNKYKKINAIYLSDWRARPYIEDDSLSPGESVLLHVSEFNTHIPKKSEDLRHSAIYLGDNTYISLYGARGPIVCASMDQMKKFWEATSVLVLHPV